MSRWQSSLLLLETPPLANDEEKKEEKEEEEGKGPIRDGRFLIVQKFIHQLRTFTGPNPRASGEDIYADGDDDDFVYDEEKEDDGGPELNASVKFLEIVDETHKMCESYLRSKPGHELKSVTKPTDDDYVRFWSQAPAHCWQTTGTNENDAMTINEFVWLTRCYLHACVLPRQVNLDNSNEKIVVVVERLHLIRKDWSITPVPTYEIYVGIRNTFMSMLVFLISEGIKTLMDRKAIPSPAPRVIAPPKPKPKPKPKKEESKEEKKKAKALMTRDTPWGTTIEVDKSTIERLNEDMAVFSAVGMVGDWLSDSSRTFPFIDACMYLLRTYPVVPLVPAVDHKPTQDSFELWIRRSVKNVPPEEFKQAVLTWACRLALPIGSLEAYTRKASAATISMHGLYQSEYGEEEATMMKHGVMKLKSDVLYNSKDVKGRCKHACDGLLLNLYTQGFINKISIDWSQRFFVDTSDLRVRMSRIMDPEEFEKKRRPMVIKMADSYYIHNVDHMIKANGMEHALWLWTYIMKTQYEGVLGDEYEIGKRWIDYLFENSKK